MVIDVKPIAVSLPVDIGCRQKLCFSVYSDFLYLWTLMQYCSLPIILSMIATIINALAIVLGSAVGLVFGKRISSSLQAVIMYGAGTITLILGIQMAFEMPSAIISLFALVIGGVIGTVLRIEERIFNLGEMIGKKAGQDGGGVGTGFLNASVLFCAGAMAVVGSIQAGTIGDYNLILVKSVMDGMVAIVFSAIYGLGTMLSAVSILVYQGFFTLLGGYLEPLLGESGINALSAEGGLLLVLIALKLLGIKDAASGNFLPALVLAPVLQIFADKL